jgi:polysaccharide biosynthesis protein PelA
VLLFRLGASVRPYLKNLLALALLLLTAVAPVRPALAFSIEFQGRGVKRTILAIYDGTAERTASRTRIHKLAEMPLNHLGFRLEFHDISTGLPPLESVSRYRAVMTWFTQGLPDPAGYLGWLDRVTASGVKLIVLGDIAPPERLDMLPQLNRVLARLGLRSADNFVELTFRTRATYVDPDMIGFERKLDKAIPGFPIIQRILPGTRTHLTLEAKTATGITRSDPVTTSEGGGYAAANFIVDHDPNTNRDGWILNPFNFFRLALGDERFPIPDVTTLSGRRIYFSHIDGDGWNNMTEVDGYRDNQSLSVEVITKEAIEAYPDLPVSVGLIAGDVQPLLGGTLEGIKWAKRLFALPHVEVASHTHTHPYNWQFFDDYDREKELELIRGYRPPAMPMRERMAAGIMRMAGKTYQNARYDPFIAGTDDLPRTYLREPYQIEREFLGALKMSEMFAPPGKKAKLYLWSGNTTPFAAAIEATRKSGVRNMNGGDSRLDAEYPSVAYVPPLSRVVGAQRQIYAVNSNENTYTNDWTGPFGGQIMLEHTLRNTELPRRLKGFNLYYHMYSGEKPAALRAITHFMQMARKTSVVPIAASRYAAMADDYFNFEIEQVDLFSWAVTRRGAVETVRFDEAQKLAVDFTNSVGVIGENRHANALYVTLDPAVERAVVSLRARPETDMPTGAGRQGVPLLTLIDARWTLSNARSSDCMQSYAAQGFGPGDITWQSERGRGFKVRASRAGVVLGEEVRWANDRGQLAISLQVNAIDPVDLVVTCHD